MSIKVACPSCGGEVLFKSRFSTFSVCSYCQSMLVRQGQSVDQLGKMAALAPDMSPLQLGVQGSFDRMDFDVVGRLRLSWSDGSWNEWYVMFADGRDGWLAEAQGIYAVSFEQRGARDLPQLARLKVGASWRCAGGQEYQVDDIKQVTCTGSEGELPFQSAKGRRSTSVDMNGMEQACATVEFIEDRTTLYLGRYVEFDQLCLKGLREIEGW